MSRHKAYALSPRDCLKTTLFQKWQRIIAPPGKRGRRTVALHEKHQPVRSNGHRVDNGNRFLPFPRRVATLLVPRLFPRHSCRNRPIFPRDPPATASNVPPLSTISRFARRVGLSATVKSRLLAQGDPAMFPDVDNCLFVLLIDRGLQHFTRTIQL